MPGIDCNLFIDLSERGKNVLNCAICLNIFNEAVISQGCGHTFCKECVKQWIDNNNSTCPECRERFSTRKAKQNSRKDEHLVIIGRHTFARNLVVNNLVNELTTKCKFESNGCQELVKFGLVPTHYKECVHRICKKCDHDMNTSNNHNCVDVVKSQNIELKREIDSMKTLLLEKADPLLNIVTLKDKVKQIDQQIEEFQSSNHLIDSSKRMMSRLIDYLLLGSHKFDIKIFRISSGFIKFYGIEITGPPKRICNIKISFTHMQELMYCSDPTLTAIIIKPNIKAIRKIQNAVDLNSQVKDLNDWFIIIVFKETIKLFFEHFIRQQIEPNINECESISVDTTKQFIIRAQFEPMTY